MVATVCDDQAMMMVPKVWQTAEFVFGKSCAKHVHEKPKTAFKSICKNLQTFGVIYQETFSFADFSETATQYTIFSSYFLKYRSPLDM